MEDFNYPLDSQNAQLVVSGLEKLIQYAQEKEADTHSGVDRLLLNSVIVESRELIESINSSLEKYRLDVHREYINSLPPQPEG